MSYSGKRNQIPLSGIQGSVFNSSYTRENIRYQRGAYNKTSYITMLRDVIMNSVKMTHYIATLYVFIANNGRIAIYNINRI